MGTGKLVKALSVGTLLCLALPLPAQAISFNEMVSAVTGKITPNAATTTKNSEAKSLADQAGVSTGTEKMAIVAGGDCGFAGKVFGCPEKGIVAPPNMPELDKTLNSLMGLANASSATPDGRRGLLQLADRLSTISPEKLKGQIESLQKADPAYQFGAARKVQFPERGDPIRNPLRLMESIVEDARNKGSKFQNGAKQSLAFLKQIHSRAKTTEQKQFLQVRIDNLNKLINSEVIPMAAKQAIAPFYDKKGEPKVNPLNDKPVTAKQTAITMMLMGVEETFKDADKDTIQHAQIATESELSLDDYE